MHIDDKLAQESNIVNVIINLKDETEGALTPQEVRQGMSAASEIKHKVSYC